MLTPSPDSNEPQVNATPFASGSSWNSRQSHDDSRQDPSLPLDDHSTALAVVHAESEWNAEHDEEFWSIYLAGYQRPNSWHAAPANLADGGKSERSEEHLRLGQAFALTVNDFCRQRGLRTQTLIEGAWALVIYRLTGHTDLVFGCSPVSCSAVCNRCHECAVSPFLGIPVRVAIDKRTRTVEWLRTLQQAVDSVMEHSVAAERIQQWSGLPADEPMFDTRVVMTQVVPYDPTLHGSAAADGDDTSWTPPDRFPAVPECPLVLRVTRGDQLALTLDFDPRCLDHTQASRILAHLEQMLFAITAGHEANLDELPTFAIDEMHRMLARWNSTEADYDRGVCLHQLFERQAAARPDALAVLDDTSRLTYAELNEHANRLAHHLNSLGIGPGHYVGVYMQRGLEMIPALLGILKAGAAYVPIEPSVPAARVQWILNSLDVSCVVSQPSLRKTLLDWTGELRKLKHVVCLDLGDSRKYRVEAVTGEQSAEAGKGTSAAPRFWLPAELAEYPTHNPAIQVSSEQDAYVIFTSGSTGTPKGVVVAHQPVINLIEWVNRTFEVGPADRLLFVTSLSFDLSVYDIFGMLAAGGSIRVAPSEVVRNPESLWNVLSSEPITFWDSAPPTLQQLVPWLSESGGLQSSSLRLVFLSGDWIPVSLPDAIRRVFPHAEVVSLGGATEATVWSNYYRIGAVERSWKSIPYGRPIQNARYYILDPQMQPCPVGVAGELYIGGDCLARGYTDPVRTAQAFVQVSLAGETMRLYRTGDLARFQPDGVMELIGRVDFQVKIRGFRVELGEIEHVILQQSGVREALAVAVGDSSLDKRIVAYVVPSEATLSVQALRTNLRKRLPGYMVPSAFVVLEKMPLNNSGKVDRNALPAPAPQAHASNHAYVAPRTGLELELTRVWERLLDIQPIGVTDNFFDLGGHSLLAIRLQHTLEGYLRRSIPLATVLQSPTIEQLASSLEKTDCQTTHRSLAIIQPGANRAPLFCLHVLGRGLEFFRPLINHVDHDLPIYGLSTEFLLPEEAPKHEVPSLANFYAQEIKAIQPQGPYFLAGLSFGGIVAYEVAQILRGQGETVAMLAMLDTAHPMAARELEQARGRDQILPGIVGDEVRQLGKKLRQRIKAFQNQWTYRLHTLECRWKQLRGLELEPDQVDFLQRRANQSAARRYRPRDYQGPVTLFKATDVPRQEVSKETGWREVAIGGMEVVEVPGGHLTMMQEPCIQVLGQRLMETLKKAEQNPQRTAAGMSTTASRTPSLIRRRPAPTPATLSGPPTSPTSAPTKHALVTAAARSSRPPTSPTSPAPASNTGQPVAARRAWIKNPSFCRKA
jgi:amino acid adenylation domain-containing protein